MHLKGNFLKSFFPRIVRRDISQFAPNSGKSFFQAWERFKDLLNACPHHNFSPWHIINILYSLFSPQMKIFVESMCARTFSEKTIEQVFEYFAIWQI